ncbi:MAG: hypothetical protein GF346_06575 [Candidatus Eisenbacteria bacterium]|nr:hypothetical protein [Candidatus Latescibacterota bacterium]MBD3302092.1 hypothetical protein [Candidatus Eisenbacteria bacterium]
MVRRLTLWIAAAIAIALLTGSAPPAAAQDLTIAFIRSEAILEQYQRARTATETFNRDVQAWNEEAQTRRRELDLLDKELQAQAPMLSDQVRMEKEQDFQQKLNEYEQFVQSVWGPNGLVTQRNEELLRDVVLRIQQATTRIAEREGYDIVFDGSDGNIIYADPAYDATQLVLDELNQTQTEP